MAIQEKESELKTNAPTNKKAKAKALVFGAAFLEERSPVVAVIFDKQTPENARGVIEGLKTLGVHMVEGKDGLVAADIALVFSEENNAAARKNGCVVVAPYKDDKTTITYNPVQEKGNGFYFKNENQWEIFAAVVRALETFQFPYDWENVVKASKK